MLSLAAVEEVAVVLVPDAMLAYNRMSVPEARGFVQRIHDAMIDMCERLQDRFAILDMPETRDIEEIRRLRQRRDSNYAAYYFPWLVVPGPNGQVVRQPPLATSTCERHVRAPRLTEIVCGGWTKT